MLHTKIFLALILLFVIPIFAFGQVNPNYHYVNGYYKSNGTYVKGHYRTNPNNTNRDNYSTIPNVNPWTGKEGWIQPDNKYKPYSSYSSKAETIVNDKSTVDKYNPVFNQLYKNEINYYNQYYFSDRLLIEKILYSLDLDTGKVDGIVDYKTVWAVRKMQDLIGVRSDGMFGPETEKRFLEIFGD